MKIAVFGDLHYPTLKESYSEIKKDRDSFFRTFLQDFFSIDADLYVSVGDLTNYGLLDELTEVFAMINDMNKPFIHVIGNHDAYGLSKQDLLAITKQECYSALEFENATLIFLDTAKEQDFTHWGGTIDDEQLQWLSEKLAKENKPALVFAHHPVYNTTEKSDLDCLSVDPTIPLQQILNTKVGMNLYVNGHNHYNSIHQDPTGNWTYLQLAAVMDEIGARLIEVDNDKITVSELSLHTDEQRLLANTIGHTIDHFNLSPSQLASEQERNLIIHSEKITQSSNQ